MAFQPESFFCSTESFSCISSEWEIVSPVISLTLNTIATKIRPYIILIVAFKEFFTGSLQTIQSSKVLGPVTENSTIISQGERGLGGRKQHYKTAGRTWIRRLLLPTFDLLICGWCLALWFLLHGFYQNCICCVIAFPEGNDNIIGVGRDLSRCQVHGEQSV